MGGNGGAEFEEALTANDPEVLYALGKGNWQQKGNSRSKGKRGKKEIARDRREKKRDNPRVVARVARESR